MLREIALHILDLAENSLTAGASLVRIEVGEDEASDRLVVRVADNGRGMDPELAARAADPFVTSRTTRRVGLGLPFFKQAAEMCGGRLDIESTPGAGTVVTAIFQKSHIDRMPLGDLRGTLLTLVVGYPEADFIFLHKVDGRVVGEFDTRPLKVELDGVPLSEPGVIKYLKEQLGCA